MSLVRPFSIDFSLLSRAHIFQDSCWENSDRGHVLHSCYIILKEVSHYIVFALRLNCRLGYGSRFRNYRNKRKSGKRMRFTVSPIPFLVRKRYSDGFQVYLAIFVFVIEMIESFSLGTSKVSNLRRYNTRANECKREKCPNGTWKRLAFQRPACETLLNLTYQFILIALIKWYRSYSSVTLVTFFMCNTRVFDGLLLFLSYLLLSLSDFFRSFLFCAAAGIFQCVGEHPHDCHQARRRRPLGACSRGSNGRMRPTCYGARGRDSLHRSPHHRGEWVHQDCDIWRRITPPAPTHTHLIFLFKWV